SARNGHSPYRTNAGTEDRPWLLGRRKRVFFAAWSSLSPVMRDIFLLHDHINNGHISHSCLFLLQESFADDEVTQDATPLAADCPVSVSWQAWIKTAVIRG